MNHETHTFLPNITPLSQFSTAYNGDVIKLSRGVNTSMGGFIDVLEESGAEVLPVLMSYGGVSGTVAESAYSFLKEEILSGIERHAGQFDGVLLALHGAMVSESVQSTETDLVHAVRAQIGPGVPLMVALDLHGNLDPAILDTGCGLFGYHESPHTDAADTGRRAARTMLRVLNRGLVPYASMTKPGLVIPSVFSATGISPARDIMDRVRYWMTQPGVIDVSFFFGFAWSDVRQLGASAVAVATDQNLAQRITADLSQLAWSLRKPLTEGHEIYSVAEGVSLAIRRAGQSSKPVILLDHSDRLNDTTFVLHELIRQGAQKACHPLLCDPEAALLCQKAGAGSTVRLSVGSKSSAVAGGPVEVGARVLWVGEKTYVGTGPMTHGKEIDLGLTAVVQAEGVWLQITSEMHSLIDTDPITEFGANPNDFAIIVTKSKTHFRAVYEEVGQEIIIVDAPAYSPVDLSAFTYVNAPRSLYPFTIT
jgi:microcystin degradation protein MlrC